MQGSYRSICLFAYTYLLVLEPGERLRGEDEPVVAAAALHDPQVVDRHVALADHLNKREWSNLDKGERERARLTGVIDDN